MATLLEKTRQVNELLQKNNLFDVQAELPYNKMAMILGDILERILLAVQGICWGILKN